MATNKVVICGAGFLGSYIAHQFARNPQYIIHLASRAPYPLHDRIIRQGRSEQPSPEPPHISRFGQPFQLDVTKPVTLKPAFESADTVVSLVGVLHGTQRQFEEIQWKGAQNVATAAKEAGARLIHVSAIGADPNSSIPYFRTKGLAEEFVRQEVPDAVIIRPSLIFGPGDGFFARFAALSRFLPFLPVFGGGSTRFQPVYAGDIARFMDLSTRPGSNISHHTAGKVIEAGGPEVFTYREMMELVLKYTGRKRPILSLPFVVGKAQGFVLEKLPTNLLTVTRDQVEQLKNDNVAKDNSFLDLLVQGDGSGPTSIHQILPTYL
ncbi:NAD(P)-binding protein [Cantharellus anzutake]|uniref:NAD(P)-binding protein n=1 Tax=Cantharellus anzutake TaxID=1750568 RepID=UPI001906203F|nr:NAD(P)-binding protein [Cantharellus anzutake]KAF8341308.1 NAD(P)-binding protein [Cantharellus anzutake]